jgi:hypothetical protein
MENCVGDESGCGYGHEINCEIQQVVIHDLPCQKANYESRAKQGGKNRELHRGRHAVRQPPFRMLTPMGP